MARIPESFDFGPIGDLTKEELLRYIQQIYTTLAIALNRKPDIIQRQVDGSTADYFLSNGDININLSTNKVEMVTNHDTISTVIWTTLS